MVQRVTTMPYVPMDITDASSVEKVLTDAKPDVVDTLCCMDGRRSLQKTKIRKTS